VQKWIQAENIFYTRGMNLVKIVLFSVLFSAFAALAHAQVMTEDTATNEAFFKAAKFKSNGYVGFEMQPSQILKSKAAMLVGFNLNWVVNHKFVVTAKYHILSSQLNVRGVVATTDGAPVFLIHHFAGLGFGYIVFHDKKFSLQPELTAGWCSAKFEYPSNTKNRKDYGAIIPAVYGIYNAHKNFRVGAGLNYRAVVGTKGLGISANSLSGVAGVIFIRVGTF
jgi:hypothetical protein